VTASSISAHELRTLIDILVDTTMTHHSCDGRWSNRLPTFSSIHTSGPPLPITAAMGNVHDARAFMMHGHWPLLHDARPLHS
jgi:hypothetical protein